MTAARRVLFVTGAYPPEFSAGGLQCQAIARVIKSRAHLEVLTTATGPRVPHDDLVEGIRVTRIRIDPARRWSRLVALARMTAALARILPRVDLVHVQGFSGKNVLLMAMARAFSRPVILHLQTAKHDEPAAIRSQGRLAWWAFSAATRYFAVSRGLADRYLDAGLPAHDIAIVPNGVDTRRFRPASADERGTLRQQLGLPVDRRLILFVGVISPDKQPHVLLDAWAELERREQIGSTLVFVGATDPRLFELGDQLVEKMRAALASIEQRDQVYFVPPTRNIEHYYRAADMVVMPSIREGLPNVVLEAMACGLPVVASRLPGSTETMIRDGVSGILVTAGDTQGFANAIGAIVKDPALGRRLGAKAAQTVNDQFRIEQVAKQWLEAYDDLLGQTEVADAR